MQTDELNHRLAIEYLDQLKGRNIPHNKVFVIFSGVPGSGKTTLARKLAHDFGAQYVRHDDIREIARVHGYDASKLIVSKISTIVIDTIFAEDANTFVIIDASLDRSWPVFFAHAKKLGAKPIVIRLNVPRDVVRKRIEARGNHKPGKMADYLDTYYNQFESSKWEVKADIELNATYDYADVCRRMKTLLS